MFSVDGFTEMQAETNSEVEKVALQRGSWNNYTLRIFQL